MKLYDSVAIVGVGLIGGSIGLALRQRRLARKVIGIGRREAGLKEAKRIGAVTATTLDLAKGVADAEVVVVCTLVDTIAAYVEGAAAAAPKGALLTDAGSTKAQIVAALDERLPAKARFIGSHPLAGSEQSGVAHARADLFEGRTVVVTPTKRSKPALRRDVAAFWSALGMRVVEMTPEAHDDAVAAVSHLPRLAAAALAGATPKKLLPLAASGWRDATRVAAGDVAMWLSIIRSNRGAVLKSVAEFERVMAEVRAAVERGDDAGLKRLLTEGKRRRDAVGS